KLVNIMLIEPLVEELKKTANRVILYGSCAQGTDTSLSDFDLFIVSSNKEKIVNVIASFRLPRGFEELIIQPVIKTSIELLEVGESERAFLEEVERGIVLWERTAIESRV
ncbi:MAG: polymerase, beta domain protein region, partial [Dehalococcoidia bacterium]|nr:polymerase, beta domain protein region [Dehalococcoidia bacterium]